MLSLSITEINYDQSSYNAFTDIKTVNHKVMSAECSSQIYKIFAHKVGFRTAKHQSLFYRHLRILIRFFLSRNEFVRDYSLISKKRTDICLALPLTYYV